MKRCGALLTLLILNFSAVAQESVASLKKQLTKASERQKAVILLQLSDSSYFSNPEKGLWYAQQALELSQVVDDQVGLQEAYFLKGRNLESLSEWQDALISYRKSLSLARKLEFPESRAKTYNRIAAVFRKTNQLDSALFYNHEAIAAVKNLPSSALLDVSLNNLAYNYWVKEQFSQALTAYEDALAANLKNKNKDYTAARYYDVGYAQFTLGNYVESVPNFKQAVEEWNQLNQPLEAAKALQSLGEVYRRQNEMSKAITVLEEALQVYNENDKPEAAAYCHMILGHIYLEKEEDDLALQYYKSALALQKKQKDRYGLISSLISMGNAYLKCEEYDRAEQYFQQSLEENKGQVIETLQAYSFSALGNIFYQLHKSEKSVEYLQKALAIRNRLYGDKHPDISMLHVRLAQNYLYEEDVTQAQQQAQLALKSLGVKVADLNKADYHIPIGSQPLLLDAINVNAEVLTLTNQGEKSLEYYQWAVDYLTENLLPNYEYSEDQLEIMKQYRSLFASGIQTAYNLYRENQEEEFLGITFNLIEKSKAILLRKTLQHMRATHYAGFPDSLLHEENNIKLSIRNHEEALYRAEKANETDNIMYWQKQLLADQEKYHQFKATLKQNYPTYYQFNYDTEISSIENIQQQLQTGQMLLTYFVGNENLYAVGITSTDASVYQIDKAEGAEQEMADMRKSLTNYQFITDSIDQANNLFRKSSYNLYQQLLEAPLAQASEDIESLIIVPDDLLNTIPFETLLTEKIETKDYQDWPFLIKNFAVSYAYAASLPKIRDDENGKQFYFAGFAPDYSHTFFNRPASNNQLVENLLNEGGLALPGAEAEVKNLANVMQGEAFVNATINDFQNSAPKSRIVHFSGHALLDDVNNDFSNLVFTPTQASQEPYLYTADIYNMFLGADMVVLSACNSGFGQVQKGEGMTSIARAFTFAGCQSLVTSLWKSPDRATKSIMLAFYNNLKKGNTKEQALRQAKLEYLSTAKFPYTHPFYWAGFVPIGDMSPIAPQTWIWYLAAGLGFMLVAGLVFWRKKSRSF